MALVDVEANEIVRADDGSVQEGVIRARWPNVEDETTYRADVYIDVDGDDVCTFGVDETFAFDIEIGSDGVNVNFVPASAGDSRGCLAFGGGSVSIAGDAMQRDRQLVAALVRERDGALLGVQQVNTGDGPFEVIWAGGTRPGERYRVDWFVDANRDGRCEVSALEGPWRTSIGILGGDPTGSGLIGGSITESVELTESREPAACESFR